MTENAPTPRPDNAANPWEQIERQGSPVGMLIFGLLAGLAIASAGLWMLLAFNPIMSEPTRTQAVLGGLNSTQVTGREGTLVCQPTFVFTDKNGQEHVSTAKAASSSLCSIPPGQPVEITYDAANPSVIGVMDASGVLIPLLAIGAGSTVIALTIGTYLGKKRKRNAT